MQIAWMTLSRACSGRAARYRISVATDLTTGWTRLDIAWPLLLFAYLIEGAAIYLWLLLYREYVALFDGIARAPDGPDDHDGASTAAVRPIPSGHDDGAALALPPVRSEAAGETEENEVRPRFARRRRNDSDVG